MTIEVYRINPETGVRTPVRPKHTVKPESVPELIQKYPPCECPRCTGGRRLSALVAEANRRSRGAL